VINILSLVAQSDFTRDVTFESTFESNNISTSHTGGLVAFFAAYAAFWLIVGIFFVVCNWKIYSKAKKPGWASLVPIYNVIVMLEIVGRPVWWIILLLIPFVNLVVTIILSIDLAKAFGKDAGFGILLLLLPIVGYPMLAFGKADYVGPVAAGGATTPAAPTQSDTTQS